MDGSQGPVRAVCSMPRSVAYMRPKCFSNPRDASVELPTMESDTTGFRFIGMPMRRAEDERLITGKGRFSDDFKFDGQTYAAMVRSWTRHAPKASSISRCRRRRSTSGKRCRLPKPHHPFVPAEAGTQTLLQLRPLRPWQRLDSRVRGNERLWQLGAGEVCNILVPNRNFAPKSIMRTKHA
jgi:hypothetical protein